MGRRPNHLHGRLKQRWHRRRNLLAARCRDARSKRPADPACAHRGQQHPERPFLIPPARQARIRHSAPTIQRDPRSGFMDHCQRPGQHQHSGRRLLHHHPAAGSRPSASRSIHTCQPGWDFGPHLHAPCCPRSISSDTSDFFVYHSSPRFARYRWPLESAAQRTDSEFQRTKQAVSVVSLTSAHHLPVSPKPRNTQPTATLTYPSI